MTRMTALRNLMALALAALLTPVEGLVAQLNRWSDSRRFAARVDRAARAWLPLDPSGVGGIPAEEDPFLTGPLEPGGSVPCQVNEHSGPCPKCQLAAYSTWDDVARRRRDPLQELRGGSRHIRSRIQWVQDHPPPIGYWTWKRSGTLPELGRRGRYIYMVDPSPVTTMILAQ